MGKIGKPLFNFGEPFGLLGNGVGVALLLTDDLKHMLTLVSSAENALDAELEAYENTQQKKLDEIDDFLDNNEKLHKEAMTRLDRMGESLYGDLLSYAKRYTDMAGDEFDKMWSDAMPPPRSMETIPVPCLRPVKRLTKSPLRKPKLLCWSI